MHPRHDRDRRPQAWVAAADALDGLGNLLVDGYNELESALRVLRRAPGDSPRERLIRSHLLQALVALDVAFFDYSRADGTLRFSLSLASGSARRHKCYFEGVVAGLDGAGAGVAAADVYVSMSVIFHLPAVNWAFKWS
jgi:hypothetical protein